MKSTVIIVVAIALAAGIGCDGMGRGVVWSDGGMVSNTAENQRRSSEQRIMTSLIDDLGRDWTVAAHIHELPEWEEPEPDTDSGQYRWDRGCTVKVMLTAPPSAGAIDQPRLVKGIEDHVRARSRPSSTVAVQISVQRTVAVAVTEVPAASATTPVTRPPVSGPRTYVIQSGDTLALISSVFYGNAQSWRTILDANPGLNPDQLVTGTTIVVP